MKFSETSCNRQRWFVYTIISSFRKMFGQDARWLYFLCYTKASFEIGHDARVTVCIIFNILTLLYACNNKVLVIHMYNVTDYTEM